MTDDNVLRLAYEVFEFLERHGRKPLVGTVLTLQPELAQSRLWEGEFAYLAMADHGTPDPEAARQLEIFLDCVGMHACTDSSYLLDPRYRALLPEPEPPLAHQAAELAKQIRSAKPSSPGWNQLLTALSELGLPQ